MLGPDDKNYRQNQDAKGPNEDRLRSTEELCGQKALGLKSFQWAIMCFFVPCL